jgi:hypothetical protein
VHGPDALPDEQAADCDEQDADDASRTFTIVRTTAAASRIPCAP